MNSNFKAKAIGIRCDESSYSLQLLLPLDK